METIGQILTMWIIILHLGFSQGNKHCNPLEWWALGIDNQCTTAERKCVPWRPCKLDEYFNNSHCENHQFADLSRQNTRRSGKPLLYNHVWDQENEAKFRLGLAKAPWFSWWLLQYAKSIWYHNHPMQSIYNEIQERFYVNLRAKKLWDLNR